MLCYFKYSLQWYSCLKYDLLEALTHPFCPPGETASLRSWCKLNHLQSYDNEVYLLLELLALGENILVKNFVRSWTYEKLHLSRFWSHCCIIQEFFKSRWIIYLMFKGRAITFNETMEQGKSFIQELTTKIFKKGKKKYFPSTKFQ